MNESTGVPYLSAWEPGKLVSGIGGIGVVQRSASDRLLVGDLVVGATAFPWKRFWEATGEQLIKVGILTCVLLRSSEDERALPL